MMSAIQRALVTGATGFLGSHMARFLVGRGVRVAILKRPESLLWRLEDILPSLEILECAYERLETLEKKLQSFKPEACYHFGWFGANQALYNDFRQITEGLAGTDKLIETVQRAGCRIWAGLGSQAEYGVLPDHAVGEDFSLEPATFYGIAKAGACFLARKFCATHQMDFLWFRLFSCYGPADNTRWLIPYVISSLLEGKTPSLTEGIQKWDTLYVEDAVEAIWQASIHSEARGIFNLGSGEAPRVRSVVELARDLAAPGAPLGFGEKPYGPGQIMRLEADISRLQSLAGWKPKVRLEDGLKKTVDWFRQNKDKLQTVQK